MSTGQNKPDRDKNRRLKTPKDLPEGTHKCFAARRTEKGEKGKRCKTSASKGK